MAGQLYSMLPGERKKEENDQLSLYHNIGSRHNGTEASCLRRRGGCVVAGGGVLRR